MKVGAYLFFNGRCDGAIDFYKKALGAELLFLMRNTETPQTTPPSTLPAGFEDKVTQATRFFNALADGGHVKMPLAKTFRSPCFGMVEDRFGVGWMVTVAGQV